MKNTSPKKENNEEKVEKETTDQGKEKKELKEKESKSKKGNKDKNKSTPSKKRSAWNIIIGILVAIIVIILIFGIGLYKYQWNDDFTNEVIKIIPYPVALANFELITYADYREDVSSLIHYYAKQKEIKPDFMQFPTEEQIKQDVLDKLIRQKITEMIANKYQVSVNQEDIDQEFVDNIIKQADNQEEAEQTLRDLYNWNIEQFKEKVLAPYLLYTKLQEVISTSDEINQDRKAQAESILQEVEAGEKSFAELAKEYSEDTSAVNGGDLGFFGRGEMAEEFEEAVFNMEEGEVSDIVKTKYGYHIIKLEEIIKDNNNLTVSTESEDGTNSDNEVILHARHILIKTKHLEDIIDEELDKAKVYRFN